jgi:serine/threonine protein kinase
VQAPPSRFGRYELLGTLGHGSFATVYRARDPLLEREVALKVLLPHLCTEPEDRQRFLAEARALAGLHHPNIVTVFEAGEEAGTPYFAMELVEGKTLAELIAAHGAFPFDRALGLLRDLAAALDAVHAASLVHRDVKDSNVLLEPSGRAVLMDFGIALSTRRTRLTQLGYGMGTPETAAPEQIRGEAVGPPADIYALGILAYQVLCGLLPFTGDVAHVLYAQAHLPPPPLCAANPALPPHVCAAVEAALAKDPARRPPSAGAFLRMVEAVQPRPSNRSAPAPPIDVTSFSPISSIKPPRPGTVSTQRLSLPPASAFEADRGHSKPSPAYRWPVVWHIAGNGEGHSEPFPLQAGLAVVRIAHRADPPSRLLLRLYDNHLDAVTTLADLPRNDRYAGIRACAPSRAGRYLIGARTAGVWQADVAQPSRDEIEAAATRSAAGSGDGVAFLRLRAGEVRFAISHRHWSGGRFRVSLLNQECSFAEVLVTAAGTFSGNAVRRIPAHGVYLLIVEAEGAWSVSVS